MLRRSVFTFISIFLVAEMALAVIAPSASPQQSWRSDIATLEPDDRPVPIPWSSRLPFPFTMAQGVWLAQKGEFKSYFSFKVINSAGAGEKQVLVRQIDAVTCDVIAQGTGLANSRTLYAQMRNTVDGRVYSLGLTSFQETVLPKQLVSKSIDGKAMILSISVVNEAILTHYIGIEKVTEKISFNCSALGSTKDKD